MGILFGIFSMLGWGIADFLGALSSRRIGYLLTLFWMQIAGFLIALIYFLIKIPPFNITSILKFLPVLVLCGFLEAVAYSAFYKGLKEGQVSLVSPIGSSWAFLTLVLGLIFLKEILSINQVIAVILIFSGIICASLSIKELREGRITTFKGVKEGLIAMLGWGALAFLMVSPAKALGWFLPVFILRLFTILFLLPFIFINRRLIKIIPHFSSFIPLIFIGFLDVVAFFAYAFGIRGEQVSIIVAIVAAFPLVTIVLARIFLKERLVLNQALGIASVITGLILISL